MTTFGQESVQCAVCNTVQAVRVLLSTYSAGSPELDTRSPGLAASATLQAIARCQSCGYSAPEIQVPPAGIEADAAKRIAAEYPDDSLKAGWLSWSSVNELAGDFAEAGWAALKAAWSCDDARDQYSAKECRLLAAAHFRAAEEQEQEYANDPVARVAIRIDVLRRAGAFEQARRTLDAAPGPVSDLMTQVFNFERSLIAGRDSARYTVQDAQRFAQGERPAENHRLDSEGGGGPWFSLFALPVGIATVTLASWRALAIFGFILVMVAGGNLIWWIARRLAS